MRVLHLTTGASYSSYFRDIVRHAERSRVTVLVGSLVPAGDLQECMAALGISTVSLGCRRRADYPRAIARLTRFLIQHRIDVVHTHLVEASLIGLAAGRLARVPARVMTRHHADAVRLSGSRRALAADRVLGHYLAEEIIAVSESARHALIDIDRVDASKITLVPYGFDWSRIEASPDARTRLRREFGIENGPVLCTVARLDPLKGHDILFRALAETRLGSKSWLLVAGGGPLEAQLRWSAQSYGIADRCIFLGHRRDIYDVMAAADLIVQPSLSESFGQVIIEALALARPVLTTSVGIAEDVVRPGVTGWIIPPGSPTALARSLCEAVADPARAHAYALAGQQRARAMYPLHRMIDGYEAVYNRRLGRPSRSPC